MVSAMVMLSKARSQTLLETDGQLFAKPASGCSLSGADRLWLLGREMEPKSGLHAPPCHGAVPGDLIPRRSSGSSHGAQEATAAREPWWEALGRRGCRRGSMGEPSPRGQKCLLAVRQGRVKEKPVERLVMPARNLCRCPLKIQTSSCVVTY